MVLVAFGHRAVDVAVACAATASPGWSACFRYSANSSAEPRFSAALSSHSTVEASRPFMAAQVFSATTATPRGISPRRPRPSPPWPAPASKLFTLAPNSGGWATIAVSMPGSFTSMV